LVQLLLDRFLLVGRRLLDGLGGGLVAARSVTGEVQEPGQIDVGLSRGLGGGEDPLGLGRVGPAGDGIVGVGQGLRS
jgi:hypothetical protein